MKKNLPVLISLILSIFIGVFFYNFNLDGRSNIIDAQVNEESQILPQKILKINEEAKTISKIYVSGKLLGVVSDDSYFDGLLDKEYNEKYVEKFPNTRLDIGQDVYKTTELSYHTYENIDDNIFNYIKDKNLFTLETTAIEFSNRDGVYAVIYVSDLGIFDEALDRYLQFFVEEASLRLLQNKQSTPIISGYGSRATGLEILENISNKKAYTAPDNIKTTVDEVLEWLKYGDNTERIYYTVKQYDTVEGVGSKNFGLSAEQIMNINSEIINSTEQVLEVGTVLNVSYFTSPIDVVVKKESVKQEPVYPEPALLVEDPTLKEGLTETVQYEEVGSKNVLYDEKWINGVLVSGTEISSVVTLQPVQEIIKVGTLVIPGVGTGTFRWPVDNPVISCGWGCYYGHRAIDIQNAYDRYGPLYAADRGIIKENSYTGINGNYVIIDHGNGYETYYGHLNVPSPLPIGYRVDKGEQIGQIGKTGWATGPHVHFFIMYYGERKNPCEGYLDCY
ncbi:MAG TPA: hypothetical protein DHS57_01660 [Erysipelotrichaceae bacterium]|jgi:murein DD-endopeptidase MepM/ murein hydrolase activator NlpD|nr:hypothetical protein [Erysipelotrichaceae bacterium]